MVYAGSSAASALSFWPVSAIRFRTSPMPMNGSRTNPTRGSITPPLPSPSITAPAPRIISATLASPTADRRHGQPSGLQRSSTTREVGALLRG